MTGTKEVERREQPEQPQAPKTAKANYSTKKTITLVWPSVKLPGGRVVKCPHSTWGHSNEKAAQACARKLAADNGVTLG